MDKKLIDEIHSLAKRADGTLTPDRVVAAAHKKGSALYKYFAQRGCWDVKTAQAKYCIIIAREVIASVRVEVSTIEYQVHVPVYVRDPKAAPGQGYVSLSRLRNDEELSREFLIEQFKLAAAAMKRAKSLAAALSMQDQIDDILSRLSAATDHAAAAH